MCRVTCSRDRCCRLENDSARFAYAIHFSLSKCEFAVRGWATRVTCAGDTDARTRVSSRTIHCGGRRCRAAAIPRSSSTRRTTRFIALHGNYRNLLRDHYVVEKKNTRPRHLVSYDARRRSLHFFVCHAVALTVSSRLLKANRNCLYVRAALRCNLVFCFLFFFIFVISSFLNKRK